MFCEAGVPEEESVAKGTGHVGFTLVDAIGAILAFALVAHRSAAGMVSRIVRVEGFVAFVTPVTPVDETGERNASVVMGVGFDQSNLMRAGGSFEDDSEGA